VREIAMESAPAPVPRRIVSDFTFTESDRNRLAAVVGADALVLVATRTELPAALQAHPETDVLCTFRPPADTLALAPHLLWLALPSAGADGAIQAGLLRPDGQPIVTNASGVHAVPISEFVFGALLMWVRHWPAILQLQRDARWPDHSAWERLRGHELHGATLAVVGLGAIGRQLARVGRALGMRVIATRRSTLPGAEDPEVDALFPLARLNDMLGEADFVVIAVPRTAETDHLIGPAQLRAMRPGAFFVNIARGSIVDEPALIEALRTGAIAGAALDVFEREPLPRESPLWSLPNVIISPHAAGSTDAYSHRFTDLFLENIARYRAGQPLRNIVRPERGY
jgi:phosphoglycerate dehydrogenase-like enzyme